MTYYPRVIDFDRGIAMVVTDLHGHGDAFDQVVHTFDELKISGKADRLIICGDLIHAYAEEAEDASLRMLQDVRTLQQRLGTDTVILLLGNHEMPHIYGVSLMKGDFEFTPRFERALNESGQRDELLAFLQSLPIYARTAAGVLITHAGASEAIRTADDAEHIFTFDHAALLHLADDYIRNRVNVDALKSDATYLHQATYYHGIAGVDDPRFLHWLRAQIIAEVNDEFEFLWDVLFAQNETRWGIDAYCKVVVPLFLQAVSAVSPYEQRVLVAGHIGVMGGHKLIGEQHLRLATYAHAKPPQRGNYLLLDCGKPISSARELLSSLHPLYS